MIRVRPMRRGLADGGATYYARWCTVGPTGIVLSHCRKLFRTAPTPDRNEAQAARRRAEEACAELQREMNGGPDWIAPDAVRGDFAESVVPKYEWHLSRMKQSRGALHSRLAVARDWAAWFRANRPRAYARRLSQNDINAWREDFAARHDYSDRTLLTYLSAFQNFLDYGEQNGWWPARLVAISKAERRKFDTRASRPVVLDDERIACIFAASAPGIPRDALELLALTGLRQGELRGLTKADYSPVTGILHVPQGPFARNKHHERILPLGRVGVELVDGLVRSHRGDYLLCTRTGGRLINQVGRWCKAAGARPHDFRKWFYTTLAWMECPDLVIRQLVGHTIGRTRESYLAEAPISLLKDWMGRIDERVGAILAKLNAALGAPPDTF